MASQPKVSSAPTPEFLFLGLLVGQLFGKQKLRVWGIGEVNRKSVAGTWGCFGSFVR